MLTKFFTSIIFKNDYSEIFLLFKKNSCVISSTMKFFHYGSYPLEITVYDNRNFNGRNQSNFKFHHHDFLSTRSFLNFNGNHQGKNKKYQGRKLVGYSPAQMFDVVADVERYERFLPFCKKSFVTFKSPTNIKADLVIGFPPLLESYTSNVSLMKPHLIKAVCTEGKLFNYLLTIWKFSPGLKNIKNTSIIDFFVSFEFKTVLHSHLGNLFFNEIVFQMENAFYQEAQNRYGEPAVKMQTLNVSQNNS